MKKKDKIKVELNNDYCCMSYDDIVANYNQIEKYLKDNKLSEYYQKITNNLSMMYKDLFIQKLTIHSNISKSDFYIYVKVKKELERIKEVCEVEFETNIKEYLKSEGIWK